MIIFVLMAMRLLGPLMRPVIVGAQGLLTGLLGIA